MRGQLTLRATDQEGRILEERVYKNRIVRAGRLLVAQMFGGVSAGPTPTKVTHLAVGTGSAAPTDDDTALKAEVARKAISSISFKDVTETSPTGEAVKRVVVTVSAVYDFAEANGTTPLREAGVFNAASGGVMYNRVVFDPVTKTNTFKLTLLWDIYF